MAYKGNQAPIPLGQLGLRTDDPMSNIPPNAAIKAYNVDFFSSRLEKAKGSRIYNSTPIPDSIVGVQDWFPSPTSQRLIAVTEGGSIYRDTGSATFGGNTPIKTGLGTLDNSVFFTSGGAEDASAIKKLFIYTDTNQIQVIAGDAATTRNIAFPSPDWSNSSGRFATVGVIFQNRHVVACKHNIYLSNSFLQNSIDPITGDPSEGQPSWSARITATTTNSPTGYWSVVDYPGSGITHFIVDLREFGTNTTIDTYNTTGYETSHQFTSLSLVNGTQYYMRVRGYDAANVLKSNNNSDNFTVSTGATELLLTVFGHEDFRTADAANPGRDAVIFSVFPGEADEIVALTVYKGRLFIFKRPFGVYYLETNNSPLPENWALAKLTDSFGVASNHAIIQPLDDLVAGNTVNSITSLNATNALGGVESGDLLAINQVEQYFKSVFDSSGIPFMHALYYAEKKRAYFTGRASINSPNNLMLIVDAMRATPRLYFYNKDQPNCLALRRASDRIERPMYGADDGHVYLLEDNSYNVGGDAYPAEFQTPYIDFSYLDPNLSGKNKNFDFLEVQFIATGNWSFYVDVYIDNRFSETLNYKQSAGASLDSFILDTDRLAIEYTQNQRVPLHGSGRRISLRIYNNNLNEFFRVEKLIINFRLSGEQQTGISGTYSI